jgi:outer membrane lipoprotein-sorting protein
MLTHKTTAACFVLLALLIFDPAADCQPQTATAQSIVESMAAQYANASSYQDTGVVVGGKPGVPDWDESVITFKTYFTRPHFFRFDWTSRWPGPAGHISSTIWNDGKEMFVYYGWERAVSRSKDIDLGIAGATGVSFASAHTVPALLMKEVSGFRLTAMTNLSLLGEENFEGEDCYIVRGYHTQNFPVDMWIGKRDFLLRKTKSLKNDGFSFVEIRRDVKINGEIPKEVFDFRPPA